MVKRNEILVGAAVVIGGILLYKWSKNKKIIYGANCLSTYGPKLDYVDENGNCILKSGKPVYTTANQTVDNFSSAAGPRGTRAPIKSRATGRKVVVQGDLYNPSAFIRQARELGKLGGITDETVMSTINSAVMKMTNGGTDPSTANVVKCKKSCSANRSGGTCVLGGCFTLKGFPPKKFSWTWDL